MNKIYIAIVFFIILTVHSSVKAMDYFPELSVDPFYSSLNPESKIDEDTSNDSVFDFIKNKKNLKKEKETEKNEKKDKEIINEDITAVEAQIPEDTNKEETVEEIKNNILEGSKKNEKKRFFIFNKEDETNKVLTPAQRAEAADRDEKLKEKELQRIKEEKEKASKPSFRDNFYFLKKKSKKVQNTSGEVNKKPAIEMSADYMEYFPDRYEVEAVGNAKILFTKNDTLLSAEKIIFNYDRNIVKAFENVILNSKEAVTEGDYIKIDLSKPDGFIENPMTSTDSIKLSAKNANLYSDKIEEYDGVAKILKNEVLRLGMTSFANYLNQGSIFRDKSEYSNIEPGVYSLKAKDIIIDSLEDHEVITIKNAGLYLKNHKIGAIPSVRIVTNKNNTNIETNLPEFGSQTQLGMHIGPAVVLNIPGGSTLKLAPILTYKSDKLGVGGIARFRNQYNMTEVAYGTSKDELVLRGVQKLGPGLNLNYSRYTNENEWFLGYRMPKYSINLNYTRSDNVPDLKLRFSQNYSMGLYVDNRKNKDLSFNDAEGRFRWMTQTVKPIYTYSSDEGNIGFNMGVVAQTSATAYTTGDVTGIFRTGPFLRTNVGPWKQSLAYYQGAVAGRSPFVFDRYRYGRSNFVVIESLKVSKYLSVGYLVSLALNRTVKNDDKLQENRVLLSIGPDYAKFTIGYDAYRRNTMFLFSMLVGTQDSDIQFDKAVLKNPQNFGSSKKKEKPKKRKSVKKYLKQIA